MTTLINKTHTRGVQIEMKEWGDNQWTPDWSADFFNGDRQIVDDIDYCIEQAQDWQNGIGDYQEDEDVNPEDRLVDVTEMTAEEIALAIEEMEA